MFVLTTIFSCKTEERYIAVALTYPETKKANSATTYFATEIKDPNR
jgi:hypothetical protein